MTEPLYTIGHSTHSLGKLISLLKIHQITVVADVRSQPYSRYNDQFNRESFRDNLKLSGLSYVFLGRELGARPEDRSCYVDGKVKYDSLAHTAFFKSGLERIAQGIKTHRIALLCAEKDPLFCHRSILVCRYLCIAPYDIEIQHILEDGRLEDHGDALTRLLEAYGLAEEHMFMSLKERTALAYARRGEEIAYSEHKPVPEQNLYGVLE